MNKIEKADTTMKKRNHCLYRLKIQLNHFLYFITERFVCQYEILKILNF